MSILDDFTSRGWNVDRIKNFWQVPNDENAYQGVNVGLQSPDGVWVELQFHTPVSLDVKERLQHAFYERQRADSTPIWEKRLLGRVMELIARQIPIPPDLERIMK